jgi:hypothetical protein
MQSMNAVVSPWESSDPLVIGTGSARSSEGGGEGVAERLPSPSLATEAGRASVGDSVDAIAEVMAAPVRDKKAMRVVSAEDRTVPNLSASGPSLQAADQEREEEAAKDAPKRCVLAFGGFVCFCSVSVSVLFCSVLFCTFYISSSPLTGRSGRAGVPNRPGSTRPGSTQPGQPSRTFT